MPERWVWFDFENTPHVLFLEPLIARVRAAGYSVGLSAKPQAQTIDLATRRGLAVERVGSGEYTNRWAKTAGGIQRAFQLVRWVGRKGRPELLVSSSRTASLAASMLRIPTVSLMDYEHSEHRTIAWASQVIWLPDLLRDAELPDRTRLVARFFEGLKENLYLDAWEFDRASERTLAGFGPGDYAVVSRPPAAGAHYAAPESGRLWLEAMRALLARPEVRTIVIPRNAAQRGEVTAALGDHPRLTIVQEAVSGPSLVAAADLVVGGGGTMNREAAVLGVPVWSVFTGPAPSIDEHLAAEGRLRWLRTEDALRAALRGAPPALMPQRRPFPNGIAAITRDIETRLHCAGEIAHS
jgi:uncharacterized protein